MQLVVRGEVYRVEDHASGGVEEAQTLCTETKLSVPSWYKGTLLIRKYRVENRASGVIEAYRCPPPRACQNIRHFNGV